MTHISSTFAPHDPSGFNNPGMPGWFGGLFVIFLLVAVGTTAYKVWWTGELARRRGRDPSEARMTGFLTGDLGTAATYLMPDKDDTRAAAAERAATETPTPAESVEARLARLDDLRTRGVITEAEAADQRAAIIDDL